MEWDEAEHPRDLRTGEFVDKPGGWVHAVSAAIGGIPTYHPASPIDPDLAHRYSAALQEQLRISHEEDRPPFHQLGGGEYEKAYQENQRWYNVQAELRGAGYAPGDMERIHQQAQREYYRDWYRRRNHPDLTTEQLHQQSALQARQVFAGRQVAVRTTPAGLAAILEQGRFRTSHDIGVRSRGLNDVNVRAAHEQSLWGYGPDTDPSLRPVYGYLAGPERHADKDGWDDALSQYGRIEVRLKPSVRSRTTAMFGDSLDLKHAGEPSAVDNPQGWAWTYGNPGGIVTHRLATPDRDPDEEGFIGSTGYIEAQIHGGVQLSDIERVVFPAAPSAALKRALEAAGIPWKVVGRAG